MIEFLVLTLVAVVGGILVHSAPRGSRQALAGTVLLAYVGSQALSALW